MYEALALAIEMNQGSAADIKKALNYAADLAQRTHNPNHLVSVADKLFMKGYLERVGPLLDEAMPQGPAPVRADGHVGQSGPEDQGPAPHGRCRRATALAGLARPGRIFPHRVAANQVEILAKALREDGQGAGGRRAAGETDARRRRATCSSG